MKKGLGLLVCALTLLAFASTAQSDGGDASGTFTFALGTAAGTVNFFGHLAHKDEPASGQISLHATIDVSDEVCWNVAGVEEPPQYVCEPLGDYTEQGLPRENVALDFLIDRMVVVNNRAAMSGTIPGNTPSEDLHTILAVENASGNDGFTWGIYKTKIVNTNAKDFDRHFYAEPVPGCPDPNGDRTQDCDETCQSGHNTEFFDVAPPPSCPADDGATLTYVASDYELCPYPAPTITGNFLGPIDEGNQGGNPHDYTCATGAPDPNPRSAGILVEADEAHTITRCTSFPLFTYPMTPIPHGGGNKVTVKDNG